jgi:hypothetical protein
MEILHTTHGYFVESESVPGAFRLVRGRECSCPATVDRCRHIRAVHDLVKAENQRLRRPPAPFNPAVFVD